MKAIKWEYKMKYFGGHQLPEYKIADYLNDEGGNGWELVTILIKSMINDSGEIATYKFIFKRKTDN